MGRTCGGPHETELTTTHGLFYRPTQDHLASFWEVAAGEPLNRKSVRCQPISLSYPTLPCKKGYATIGGVNVMILIGKPVCGHGAQAPPSSSTPRRPGKPPRSGSAPSRATCRASRVALPGTPATTPSSTASSRVRSAGRSIPPQWGSVRLRPQTCTRVRPTGVHRTCRRAGETRKGPHPGIVAAPAG